MENQTPEPLRITRKDFRDIFRIQPDEDETEAYRRIARELDRIAAQNQDAKKPGNQNMQP